MNKETRIIGIISIAVIAAAIIGATYYRSSVENVRITATTDAGRPNKSSEQLVRPDSPVLGPADAPVTLVEFYDPECESCAAFAPAVKKIYTEYGGKVKLVMRYMPLHPNSLTAATFIEAAGEQGKYWEAQDLLFKRQPEWGTKHGPQPTTPQPSIDTLFKGYAAELGLDTAKMDKVFAENRYAAKVDRDQKDGQALGIRQTPTIFVNGRQLSRLGESELRSLIDMELAAAKGN